MQASEPGVTSLTYSVTDLPAGLSINAATGLITGTVAAGDATAGDDGLGDYATTVRVTDGTHTAVTTIDWTVGVSSAPQPLVAAAESAATTTNAPIRIAVLANDFAPDGSAPTVTAVGAAAHGTTVRNGDGTITYTPAAGYTGSDSFSYSISDASGQTASASVTVTVSSPSPAGTIGGVAWVDTNGDGTITPGEPMAAGVSVTLYQQTGTQLQSVATTTTGSNGAYQFSTAALAAGIYRLAFVDPTGADCTTLQANGWTARLFVNPNATLVVNAGMADAKAAPTPFTTILRQMLDPKNPNS